ncbi:caffeoyl-CoA O-methyltransferase [Actinomycetospora succinea]|uniref:Caffeoyl-CoA O-methyltransferase n=1 Tax=Actinomycetospora succinea TaxID=663603 RepID=A0A4R6VKU2_9PSEU|nr:class I SAM-dependent methyltransferase [Actinomycetospora succinea]TDQ62545.1 caffeoyl-CoA O-methyltransferase [Actinomycetospora succinea]
MSAPPRPVTPVGILAATLERVADGLAGVADVPDEVRDDLEHARALAGGLDPYLEQCTTPESPALARLAAATHEHDWSARDASAVFLEQEMLSGHVEGQTLKMLVAATRARKVLEIGLFTGYSALAMAEALPEGGRLLACELDAEVAARACRSFADSPAGGRITVEVGPAAQTLAALVTAGDQFDLVFVDADKAGYADYVATLLDGELLAPHGLICVDNTLMQGEPWTGTPGGNGKAIADFNDTVAADPRVEQVLLPLRDGLTLIRRAHVDQAA